MTIVKVIEILAESEKSWEDAARVAVQEASKTIQGIRSVYIKELQAVLGENNQLMFRADCKISFVVEETRRARHRMQEEDEEEERQPQRKTGSRGREATPQPPIRGGRNQGRSNVGGRGVRH
jgi:dodecin